MKPHGAISQQNAFIVRYEIDPIACNDCNECVDVCPIDALVPDPAWAVCLGRGCPLSSRRYADWTCSQGQQRCPRCGSMMWQPPHNGWVCSSCRAASGPRAAQCPKTARAAR